MGAWLILFVVLVFIEISTVNLVSIWFALGALVTALISLWITDTTAQLCIFAISSAVFFALTKPLVARLRAQKIIPTNSDRVIGKIGIVTEEIQKLEPGEVKVDGKRWTAEANRKIAKGKKVEILSIDGVKLQVKEVKEEE